MVSLSVVELAAVGGVGVGVGIGAAAVMLAWYFMLTISYRTIQDAAMASGSSVPSLYSVPLTVIPAASYGVDVLEVDRNGAGGLDLDSLEVHHDGVRAEVHSCPLCCQGEVCVCRHHGALYVQGDNYSFKTLSYVAGGHNKVSVMSGGQDQEVLHPEVQQLCLLLMPCQVGCLTYCTPFFAPSPRW